MMDWAGWEKRMLLGSITAWLATLDSRELQELAESIQKYNSQKRVLSWMTKASTTAIATTKVGHDLEAPPPPEPRPQHHQWDIQPPPSPSTRPSPPQNHITPV